MDPVPPDVKQEMGAATPSRLAASVGARRYPKPPALLKRLLLLMLKPEAWPAAAKYPLWVTLVPLFLAILISASAFGAATSMQVLRGLNIFAQNYDVRFPELDLNSDGVLSAKAATPSTLPAGATAIAKPPFEVSPGIIVDTTGKTTVDSIKDPFGILITNRQIFYRELGHNLDPIDIKDAAARMLPERGAVTRITGATIKQMVTERHAELLTAAVILAGTVKFLSETLWSAMALFVIFPLVSIGAGIGRVRLFVPRRAAYRIAAAVLVPIVLFSGLTSAAGYSVGSVVGAENSAVFWFFASAALAFWAGHMAKHLFTPKAVRRRTT